MFALVLLAGTSTPLPAATTGSPFLDMIRGMATGLALLGQSANTGTTAPTVIYPVPAWPPGYAWPPAYPPPPWGGAPGWGAAPYGAPPWGGVPWNGAWGGDPVRRLQGAWETDHGGLLLVKDHVARLYASRDEYQDYYLRADPRFLWLQPVEGGVPTRYEHRIYGNRIVLRDARGNRMVLRRYRPGSSD